MKSSNIIRNKMQIGFTLVELLVVIAILGVLGMVARPFVTDGQKLADATSYWTTADRFADNWRFINMKCQVSNNQVGSSPITTTVSATAHLTMLVEGTGVAASYQGCYNSARVETLNRVGVRGTGGTYTLNNNAVTIANVTINGVNRMAVTYANVDDNVILELINKYGGQANAATITAVPAAADTTDNTIRFAAAGTGTRNLTIIR